MPSRAGSLTVRRRIFLLCFVLAAITTVACFGGGGGGGSSGCGLRPPGLTAEDLVGTWESDHGATVILNADGTYEWFPAPPSASPPPSPPPADLEQPERRTGRWEIRSRTLSGDITMTPDEARTAVLGLFATDTRAEPSLYSYGSGDPDSCIVVRYERVSS